MSDFLVALYNIFITHLTAAGCEGAREGREGCQDRAVEARRHLHAKRGCTRTRTSARTSARARKRLCAIAFPSFCRCWWCHYWWCCWCCSCVEARGDDPAREGGRHVHPQRGTHTITKDRTRTRDSTRAWASPSSRPASVVLSPARRQRHRSVRRQHWPPTSPSTGR